MRAITKGIEPACLAAHRAMEHSFYQNYQGKDALRIALVAEQRGLCCYCMGRISADRTAMKIEHWLCQANYPQLQLQYENLLGACLGGHGEKPEGQTCDNRKGDQNLKWNPSNPAHNIEVHVKYQSNGEIRSDDPQFDGQLDTVLNLNIAVLKNSRKSALDAVLEWWQIQQPSNVQVQAEIDQYYDSIDELVPFRPVAIWFLKRKLAA